MFVVALEEPRERQRSFEEGRIEPIPLPVPLIPVRRVDRRLGDQREFGPHHDEQDGERRKKCKQPASEPAGRHGF